MDITQVINHNVYLPIYEQINVFKCSTPIKQWIKYVRNITLKIKIHGFRHTHCSLLFEAGLSIQEVQDRLGHGDINTTMDVYAHITENNVKKLLRSLQIILVLTITYSKRIQFIIIKNKLETA